MAFAFKMQGQINFKYRQVLKQMQVTVIGF